MKAFIQYLTNKVVWKEGIEPGLIPACGDRAVIILDGRQKLHTWIMQAFRANESPLRGYPGFEIHKGNFKNSTVIFKHEEK